MAALKSLITPTLLELFPPFLPALLYPHQPRAGVPLRQGLPYLPRKVTLAIRSQRPRSSETVLRWTSRAMLVW